MVINGAKHFSVFIVLIFLCHLLGIKKFTYTTLIAKSHKLKNFLVISVLVPVFLSIAVEPHSEAMRVEGNLGSSDGCFPLDI